MDLRKIKALEKKARNEAQEAIDKIYASYDEQMKELLAEQIPNNLTLKNGNGISMIIDSETFEMIETGKGWGIARKEQLDQIAMLQYPSNFRGGFLIDDEIKGKKLPLSSEVLKYLKNNGWTFNDTHIHNNIEYYIFKNEKLGYEVSVNKDDNLDNLKRYISDNHL